MEKLKTGKVIRIEDFAEGKRVLLDFMLDITSDQYILVGRTMTGFIPVVSENHPSENYRPRSFRFNVGAMHQYIVQSDTSCRYIDELTSGDEIEIYNLNSDNGKTVLKIGRIKKEIREFVKIDVQYDEEIISAVLQKGETTAILTPNGIGRVLELKPGDDVYVLPFGKATHLGSVREEFVEEL